MTLHELCDAFGVSRRTVQGYEKHGLVRSTGRNMRGYLLYDPQMQAEIRRVRQLQNFGFRVKEIKALMLLPKAELRDRLTAQKSVLEQRGAELSEQLAPASDEERGAQDSLQEDAAQSADAAEETDENSASLADDGFIRPEFKEAMDSYEAFFAEYAALMQAISDDPGDLTLLARYAAYMNRYTETMEALDSIEEGELTTAELSYYIEVMSRIQQLLLAAAG